MTGHHDDDALPRGTLVGEFRIDEVLGSGGFAITYGAWDTRLHRRVAIKEYFPEQYAGRSRDALTVRTRSQRPGGNAEGDARGHFEAGLAMFLEEGRALAQIAHSGVVRVITVLEANATAYLVMDRVDGETLAQRIAGARKLDEGAVRSIAGGVLDALESIHATGLLHRDVTPRNIMIQPDGKPMLIDFGAARMAVGEHSRSMNAVISEGYSPIEQYSSSLRTQGTWTDIYAFGATLYTMLTGRRPASATDRSHAVLQGELDPIESAAELSRRGVDAELAQMVHACLQIKPKDRPQSINQLRPWLAGRPIHAEAPANHGTNPGKPGDIHHRLEMSLEDAVRGFSTRIEVARRAPCPQCNGAGTKNGAPCRSCRGDGWTDEIRALEVKIPAGVDTGDRIRFAGQGQPARNDVPTGDLYAEIVVQEHQVFKRDGDDLYCEILVTSSLAQSGGELKVELLDGSGVMLKIPAGSQTGRLLRARGLGVRSVRSPAAGDLLCRVCVLEPERASGTDRGRRQGTRPVREGERFESPGHGKVTSNATAANPRVSRAETFDDDWRQFLKPGAQATSETLLRLAPQVPWKPLAGQFPKGSVRQQTLAVVAVGLIGAAPISGLLAAATWVVGPSQVPLVVAVLVQMMAYPLLAGILSALLMPSGWFLSRRQGFKACLVSFVSLVIALNLANLAIAQVAADPAISIEFRFLAFLFQLLLALLLAYMFWGTYTLGFALGVRMVNREHGDRWLHVSDARKHGDGYALCAPR
jgi:serine/threonine protein kinase